MSDKVKINLYIGTGFARCTHEDVEYVDRAEWEAMTSEQRQAYLEDAAATYLSNHIDYSASVEEGEAE